jgi:hypothetical protein
MAVTQGAVRAENMLSFEGTKACLRRHSLLK